MPLKGEVPYSRMPFQDFYKSVLVCDAHLQKHIHQCKKDLERTCGDTFYFSLPTAGGQCFDQSYYRVLHPAEPRNHKRVETRLQLHTHYFSFFSVYLSECQKVFETKQRSGVRAPYPFVNLW